MSEIVTATVEHADQLARTLRDLDKAELAAFGVEPATGLRQCVQMSLVAQAAIEDGEAFAIWGFTAESLLSDKAAPWMLGGHGLLRNRKLLLLHSRAFTDWTLQLFPRLENVCLAEYEASLRWLRWLGYTIHPPKPMGPLGVPFCRFEMGGAAC
jgi:hypothetical protein